MDGESSAQSHGHGSVSKKRGSFEIEEASEKSPKRVKMRDLGSVFRYEAPAGRGGSNTTLDLNVDVGSINIMVGGDDPAFVDESNNPPISGKIDVQCKDGLTKASGFDLDLNAADISSPINELFNPYKMNEHLRFRDDSDCVSSVGTSVEKDPMSLWKGLKQNNYMSSPYGAVPMAIPKARGRKKSNHDVTKKKTETKKEQVNRFARVSAPSGLLNGLNPGIINHVRNSKQVHSIIEALVKSERTENQRKKRDQIKNAEELFERKGAENQHGSGIETSGLCYGVALLGKTLTSGYTFWGVPSRCKKENEDDKLPLKLSSSVTVASENASCLSNGECSVTSLSLKAANVASQWLELLNQDIRGRLAAIKGSRKRVCAVITTELPLLTLKEFSFNVEKDVHLTKDSTYCHFDQATADVHSAKWSTLFVQMETALSEEENHLVGS